MTPPRPLPHLDSLRCCSYCAVSLITHNGGYPDGSVLCREHDRALWAGYDPQPGDTVRLVDGSLLDKIRDYVVLARDGEDLTMRRIGAPDAPVEATRVGCTWPGFGRVQACIQRGLSLTGGAL